MILISILIAVAIIIGLLGLSVYMLRPETEKTRSFAAFDNTMIAHRGLFNNNSDAPENSLAAFRNALEHGFGMELDVQLTKDGKLVVFHDFDLKRMCGVHKKLTELTYAELEQYSLKNSTEKIPLFLMSWNWSTEKCHLWLKLKLILTIRQPRKRRLQCCQNTRAFIVWNALIHWHWYGTASIFQRCFVDSCLWTFFRARIKCRRSCVFS